MPSHGFIAVKSSLARENRWPDSMYLPSDDSKEVYLLEAYHQLHCLVSINFRSKQYAELICHQKILRKTFWETVEGKDHTYALSHSEHCFDALRQVSIR